MPLLNYILYIILYKLIQCSLYFYIIKFIFIIKALVNPRRKFNLEYKKLWFTHWIALHKNLWQSFTYYMKNQYIALKHTLYTSATFPFTLYHSAYLHNVTLKHRASIITINIYLCAIYYSYFHIKSSIFNIFYKLL